jgi:hypothetical protein
MVGYPLAGKNYINKQNFWCIKDHINEERTKKHVIFGGLRVSFEPGHWHNIGQ